ncbi:hypothetical protein ACFQVA_40630 [Actinomadura keratinilytica]
MRTAMWIALRQHDGDPGAAARTLALQWGTAPPPPVPTWTAGWRNCARRDSPTPSRDRRPYHPLRLRHRSTAPVGVPHSLGRGGAQDRRARLPSRRGFRGERLRRGTGRSRQAADRLRGRDRATRPGDRRPGGRKTHLAHAFAAHAAATGALCLTAALRRRARGARRRRRPASVRPPGPPGDLERVTRLLSTVTPETEAPVLRTLGAELLTLARQRPVVVLVDDAHLSDALSARLLAHLRRRSASAPVMLVLTRWDWEQRPPTASSPT